MASQKISQLTEATSITGTEKVAVALNGENFSLTADQLKQHAISDLPSDFSIYAEKSEVDTEFEEVRGEIFKPTDTGITVPEIKL